MKRFLLIAFLVLLSVACGNPDLITGANPDAGQQTPGETMPVVSDVKLVEPAAATLDGPRIWVEFSGNRVPQLEVTPAYDHGWRFALSRKPCANDAQVCGEIGVFPGDPSATASIMLADTPYTLTGEGLKTPFPFRSCSVQQHLFYMTDGWLTRAVSCKKSTGEPVLLVDFRVDKTEGADHQAGRLHLGGAWTGHELQVTRVGLLPSGGWGHSTFQATLDGQGETLTCGPG